MSKNLRSYVTNSCGCWAEDILAHPPPTSFQLLAVKGFFAFKPSYCTKGLPANTWKMQSISKLPVYF